MSYNNTVNAQAGFVLHARPYRETSLILEILTADYGRVGLVARGVRGKKSRQSGLIQPFVPLVLDWRGRGELHTLNNAESRYQIMQKSGRTLMSCLYVNELLLRVLHRNDPHPGIFYHYETLINDINDDNAERLLRIFETRLLNELGYGLLLDTQADKNIAVEPDRKYTYVPEYGPVEFDETIANGVSVSGKVLLALATETLNDRNELSDAKHLLRSVINKCIGNRPLNSRALYQSLSRQIRNTEQPVIEEVK